MTRPGPTPHVCRVYPGCSGIALHGFRDPHRPDKGTLWACRAHRDEAEARWQEATGRQERPLTSSASVVVAEVSVPVQGSLFG